jgi:hypothetical protein
LEKKKYEIGIKKKLINIRKEKKEKNPEEKVIKCKILKRESNLRK